MAKNESLEINKWLCAMYGSCSAPPYELNSTTLHVFNCIMKNMNQRRKFTQLMVKDAEKKALEYMTEGQRIKNVLHCNGIGAVAMVHNIATIACLLGLQNSSTASILMELAKFRQEHFEVTKAVAENTKFLDELSSKMIIACQKQQQFERITEKNWSKRELLNRSKAIRLLEVKLKDYQRNIDLLETKLQGYEVKSNSHTDLVKTDKHVKDLKNRLTLILSALKTYACLPHDEVLAREKIREARKELQELEAELSCKIERISQDKSN